MLMRNGALVLMMLTTLICGFSLGGDINSMSVNMESSILHDGKYVDVHAELYWRQDGRMVARYLKPSRYVVISTPSGRVTMYDEETNEVNILNDPAFGSSRSWFYCFMNRQTSDLSLKNVGFELVDARFEDPYQVSVWTPSQGKAAEVGHIELAHKKGVPVYAGYYSAGNEILTDTFFEDGKMVGGRWFPMQIVSVRHISPTDSVVERTRFKNIRRNEEVDRKWLNYTIPSGAKFKGE